MINKPEIIVFDTLFEAVSEAVIIIDQFQKIRTVNVAAEKMFGYEEGGLLNESIEIIIPEKHRENYSIYFDLSSATLEKTIYGKEKDVFVLHKKGKVFPVQLKLNLFEIEGAKYLMGLIKGLSSTRKRELELIEMKAKLEENVLERTRSLRNTVEKLEKMNQQLDEENKKRIEAENKTMMALQKERELNELKTKFLSMVSHEFKTPLTGISISNMLLAKYKLTEHQDKREKHISIINGKIHYLNSIINNFLSIEKLEKSEIKYNITTFKVKDVLGTVLDAVNLLLKEGQKIICNSNIEELQLTQDEKIIELTLSNLLNNALKYSRENTEIIIEVKQDAEKTVVKIIDKGFGIPKKEQKNIFKRYFRAENVLLIEGTGIGLNIIKSHIENLGGTITFESKQNIGSTFIVTLPNKMN